MAKKPPGRRDADRSDEEPEAKTGAFLTGQLLIAMPAMADPRFAQSVIYVCAHTEDGAMGIVVNRPIERPSFEDLLRQLEVEPVPPARKSGFAPVAPSITPAVSFCIRRTGPAMAACA